jgi:adenylate kinase
LGQVQPVIDLAKKHSIVTVYIDISDEEAHRRLGGRWNCPKCGAIYNYQTPSQVKPCENCGAKLGQRSDDTTASINRRLNTFHSETEPAIEKLKEYGSVHKIRVEPETSVNEVRQRVWKAIGIE